MKSKNLSQWNVRASLVYSIGVWTMLGSYGYYRFFLNKGEGKDKSQAMEGKEELMDLSTEGEKEKPEPGFKLETTIRYKENFVPYSTRLFNYFKTLTGGAESTVESQRSEK